MPDVLHLSTFEENLYNLILRAARTQNNKPFRPRKDFTAVDDVTKSYVKKLANFFKKFDHISPEDFIIAPYKVYPDETYFDFKYFSTLKAVKAYSVYQNMKIYDDIDSPAQLENIIKSLKYIQTFCIEKQIRLEEYLSKIDNCTPCFIGHLKEHRVNVSTLFGFKKFKKEFYKHDPELIKFILGNDLYNQIEVLYNKFLKSKKAIHLITKGLNKINSAIEIQIEKKTVDKEFD